MKITHPNLAAPWWQLGGHAQTIIPGLFRKSGKPAHFQQINLDTPDGDFLEIDLYPNQNAETLVIVCHGLEGNAHRPYMLGMVNVLLQNGFAALAWSYRGCGSKLNKQPIFYHSGATYDLQTVVEYAIKIGYQKINLVGFSLGGNLVLKYLGENGKQIPSQITKAVAISVPLDLAAGAIHLSSGFNQVYLRRFLKTLKMKVLQKAAIFPDKLDVAHLPKCIDFVSFDNYYTGPLHGFKDAADYYAKCSAKFFLMDIAIPTLILSAKNDPFLPAACYPNPADFPNPMLYFSYPNKGGHTGFQQKDGTYLSEKICVEFLGKD